MEHLLNEHDKTLSIFYYYYYCCLNIPSLAKNNASLWPELWLFVFKLTTEPLTVVTQKSFMYLACSHKSKNLILPELLPNAFLSYEQSKEASWAVHDGDVT